MKEQTQTDDLAKKLSAMSIAAIAAVIARDWTKVYFGARPYLDAMRSMEKIDDAFGMDDGRSIVRYFLSNATTWKGDTARAVKAELNKRLKAPKVARGVVCDPEPRIAGAHEQ